MKKFILIVLVACSSTACPCDDDGPEYTADWLLTNMTDETIVVKSFWTYAHPEPEWSSQEILTGCLTFIGKGKRFRSIICSWEIQTYIIRMVHPVTTQSASIHRMAERC